jgi:hypothetical protein
MKAEGMEAEGVEAEGVEAEGVEAEGVEARAGIGAWRCGRKSERKRKRKSEKV